MYIAKITKREYAFNNIPMRPNSSRYRPPEKQV